MCDRILYASTDIKVYIKIKYQVVCSYPIISSNFIMIYYNIIIGDWLYGFWWNDCLWFQVDQRWHCSQKRIQRRFEGKKLFKIQ